jgi:hypothetical protein
MKPMLAEFQIFATFRWLLAIACTIYTVIVMGQTLRAWLVYFMSDRHCKILGRYTMTLLLRVRLKQFAWELTQIGVLLGALFLLVYAHGWLE